MNIIILGPQGSGKGTQAEALVKEYNMLYFEAGNFLRNLAQKDKFISETINKGELIPDEKIFELVKTFLEEKNVNDNILFDGYPRSVKQYELLSSFLSQKNQKINIAILLSIPQEESIRRLSARRIDQKTGQIYNLITNPPGPEINLNELIQRDDDKPDAIKARLENYHKSTEPLLKKLKEENILIEVDGTKSIEDIKFELFKLVNEYKNGKN
ncbi:nucleoside monophosphate kinase [Candidatus Woesebacteria bacterium]|nr:nucleoside monophosphate kinase [Candidatus Woesebacteria bacterium]QQG47801.1 MAG: nucleoside monophosphate kinase [Candidatus Woesebacteria bacterium]